MNNAKQLYEAFLPLLPPNHTPVYQDSINLVGALPGLEKWLPPMSNFMDVIRIVRIGFPLTYLRHFESVNPLRKKIAQALVKGDDPSPSDLSEIDAAALCVAIGASSIEYVKRAPTRTPDFVVSWPSNVGMELEVTSADEKAAHKLIKEMVHRLGQATYIERQPHDIIIHFLEMPDENEKNEIIKVAGNLATGSHADKPGRWHLYTEKQNRDPYHVWTGGQKDKSPSWWPGDTNKITYFTNMVAGPNATEAPPQVRISFSLPLAAYVNPIQHKAERPQCSNNLPFIVALDVQKLPGAFREYKRILPDYFMIWPELSGVIIFQQWISPNKIGWTHELLANPYAKHPLPVDLYKFYCNYQQHVDSHVILVPEE